MKTNIGGGIFHSTKYVLFFFIILILSCTSTSLMRLEGNDFEKNLPGVWEGTWLYTGMRGPERIKITKIDGNNVQLTGYMKGKGWSPDTEEVFGRIESSTLLLTWSVADCMDKLTMKRDESNNLILEGSSKCQGFAGTKVQLRKNK